MGCVPIDYGVEMFDLLSGLSQKASSVSTSRIFFFIDELMIQFHNRQLDIPDCLFKTIAQDLVTFLQKNGK